MNKPPPRLPGGGAPMIPRKESLDDKLADKPRQVRKAVERLIDGCEDFIEHKEYGHVGIKVSFEAGVPQRVNTNGETIDK